MNVNAKHKNISKSDYIHNVSVIRPSSVELDTK